MCDETELIFIKLKLSNTGDISVEFHVVNIEKFVIFLLIVLIPMMQLFIFTTWSQTKLFPSHMCNIPQINHIDSKIYLD